MFQSPRHGHIYNIRALPPLRSVRLLLLVYRQTTGAHVYEENETADNRECLEEVVFEEIAGGVARADGPPVVGEDVEYAQHDDEEGGGPLGFEADRHHDTCGEPEDGDEDAHDAPGALEDKPDEQEYEQHTASKLEVFLAVGLADGGQTRKELSE